MGAWRKQGQICDGVGSGFAAVPTARHLHDDIFRVYVSGRDDRQRSLPLWFDYDIDARRITAVAKEPLLPLGALGCFDDAGVMPCWLLETPKGALLYYIGWNQGVSVPFRNSIGVARERPNGTWARCFEGPILDRTKEEPHFVASCAVLKQSDGYVGWYLSCTEWTQEPGAAPRHHYHIKSARSDDAINWVRDGDVAIDYGAGEYAISRPCPIAEADGSLSMWFSARGEHYQIFCAQSSNGAQWDRGDEPVLTPSASGWDSDMVCYPYVFDHKGTRCMLYNGNGYGRTGVGLAVWED